MNFITGGTGIVGIRLLFDLLTNGHKVLALKRKTSNVKIVEQCFSYYGNKELFTKINWLEGNILDIGSYINYLDENTKVYHCAATVSFNPSDYEILYNNNNILGTRKIVNTCLERKIKKLCYVSSVAALGNLEDGEKYISEEAPPLESKQASMYANTKYNGELEVWRGAAEGLKMVIVNPSIILGIGNKTSSSNQFFSQIANGLKFYTKGITGFVDVRNVSKFMIALMENKVCNQRFILNSENASYEYVFKLMAKELGMKAPSIELKPWLSNILWKIDWLKKNILFQERKMTKHLVKSLHSKNYFSADKIKKILGTEFILIEESIKYFAKYYKSS